MVKKNKFLSFCFSMVPGMGQMYLGLMNTGILFMLGFIAVIWASVFFRQEMFFLVLPVIWCVSFFDFWNKRALPEEAFKKLQIRDEKVLFETNDTLKTFFKKKYIFLGGALCLLGLYILLDDVLLDSLARAFSNSEIFWAVRDSVMRAIPAVLLLAVGVKMIKGGKTSQREEDIFFTSDVLSELEIDEWEEEAPEEEEGESLAGEDDATAEERTDADGE